MIKSKLIWQEIHHTKCRHWYREICSVATYDSNGEFNGNRVTYKCDYCGYQITRIEKY